MDGHVKRNRRDVCGEPKRRAVQIGSTLAATLQNLIAALEAFVDANIMLMEYFANASNLYVEALAGGAAGNALVAVCDGMVEVSEENRGPFMASGLHPHQRRMRHGANHQSHAVKAKGPRLARP